MNGLIKAIDAEACRSLGEERVLRESISQPSFAPASLSETEIEKLRAELASLREEMDQRIATTRHEARAEGRQAAAAEFNNSRAEALERLERACNRALESFSRHMLAVENLAGMIAEAVLDQLLLGEAHYRELARAAIAARVREIDRTSIVRVLVSPKDFPEADELEQLADLCGIDQMVIAQSDELDAGQCRMELALGTLDVGLADQWQRLRPQLGGPAKAQT